MRTSAEVATEARNDLRRTAAQLALFAVVAVITVAIVLTARLWLLLFGAVLLSVLLRGSSDWLARRSRLLGRRLAYAFVCVAAGAGLTAAIWLMGPRVAVQLDELADRLPALLEGLRAQIQSLPGGTRILADLEENAANVTQTLNNVLSLSTRALVNLLVVVVTGIYVGASPGMYVRGILRLVPLRHRTRAEQVMDELGHTLWRYLLARVISMIAVGVLTGVGLALMDVPLATILGVIAGLLTFVPYAGPIAAALPIAVVAALGGPLKLLLTLAYYTGVQSIEGFIITPLVQAKAVHLPPALTLAAEVFMGLLFGALGVIISVPFAATTLVIVRMVYVHDVLGDEG